MFATETARRFIVIVDAALKDQLLKKFAELGAKGSRYVDCGGKGLHGVTDNASLCQALVRIEAISSQEVAGELLSYIHAVQFQQFGRYALAAFTDVVEVDMRDRMLTG